MEKKENNLKKEENTVKKDRNQLFKEKILVELNKEIQETIMSNTEKYKEVFKEEITNDIQNEVDNIMQQEEKKILRSRSFSIFKRDILILILVGICLYFGYCLYDVHYFDFMKSECEKNGTCNVVENNPSNPDNNKPQEVVKDTKWYLENYSYLLDHAHTNLNADNVNAYYLYSNDYTVNDIKTSYLLNMAYGRLDKKAIKTNTQNITVDGDDLKNAFETLFGSTTNYKEVSFTYDCLRFTYNKSKNRYIAENNKCPKASKEIVEKIDDIYEDGDALYIITTATIYNNEDGSFYSFDDLFEPVVSNVKKDDLTLHSKKLNKYQYKIYKIDDWYYLN